MWEFTIFSATFQLDQIIIPAVSGHKNLMGQLHAASIFTHLL